MNFFNSYGRAKKSSNQNHLIIGAVALVLLASAAFITFNLFSKRTEWDGKISALEAQLKESPYSKEQLDEIQTRLGAFQQLYDALKLIDSTIKYVNFFTADDAYTIVKSLPAGADIGTFELNGTSLTITGTLDNMGILPSVMQNLEDTGLFTEVMTSSATLLLLDSYLIESDDGILLQSQTDIEYAVKCTLKGGALK